MNIDAGANDLEARLSKIKEEEDEFSGESYDSDELDNGFNSDEDIDEPIPNNSGVFGQHLHAAAAPANPQNRLPVGLLGAGPPPPPSP